MAEQDWLTPATAPAPSPYQNVVAAPAVGPPAYELRPLTLGELLDRTFSLFRSRFWLFTGIAASAASIELVIAGAGRVILHHYSTNPQVLYTGALGVTYLASFIYFFFYCITQAATCWAMSEVYLNRRASISSSLRAVRGKWYAWIGIALWQAWSAAWPFLALFIPFIILATLKVGMASFGGVFFGFLVILLMIGAVVYGAIAYIRNSLAIPAKVVEGMTVRKAMRRSKDLAEGAKWRIFVLGLIVWALMFVAGVLQAPFAMMTLIAPGKSHIISEMVSLLIMFFARSVVTPIASIGLCLIYFDQRVRREAFDLEVLLGPEQPTALLASPDQTPPDYTPPHVAPDPAPTAEAEPNAPLL
jgi:MFS family permease